MIDAEVGKTMDGEQIFEKAHAIKGVSSNLGLVKMAKIASELSDEFRPGFERKFSDEEVLGKIQEIELLFDKTSAGIKQYEQSQL